ncbi:hypothetical protein Hsero_3243 [Herbaspirillum seropedicae SmR1]|uniref:Uncharacterized protein n=1 Tax=Herbaspirillum seropedicae (strain SmR1) TaxID=757424 RepID=D8J1F5_HERSS|nr:hypothetical protein Hsero_3243 [Herbaspirillum seropedicae SmR1]
MTARSFVFFSHFSTKVQSYRHLAWLRIATAHDVID